MNTAPPLMSLNNFGYKKNTSCRAQRLHNECWIYGNHELKSEVQWVNAVTSIAVMNFVVTMAKWVFHFYCFICVVIIPNSKTATLLIIFPPDIMRLYAAVDIFCFLQDVKPIPFCHQLISQLNIFHTVRCLLTAWCRFLRYLSSLSKVLITLTLFVSLTSWGNQSFCSLFIVFIRCICSL